MDGGFRNAFMNQDFTVVFFFPDIVNPQPFHPGHGTIWAAHPDFGCIT
jgi:hypothetical protein